MDTGTTARAPIPVTVIGGYLGAGKTTFVNHLLRHAEGLRLAVLVNDFGALPIDADLIEARDGNVIGIAGGCVCCSYGSDLIAALQDLARRSPAPEHVFVEASGVALPGQVAAAISLLPAYTLDAVITLAAADAIEGLAADRYLADTIARQLADAHILLLNKTDLVDAARIPTIEARLLALAPQARCIVSEKGQAPPAVVLGRRLGFLVAPSDGTPHLHGPHYATAAYAPAAVRDASLLAQALRNPALGLLRAKGFLAQADGTTWLLHVVGGTADLTRLPARDVPPVPALVVIGLAGRLDTAAIAALLASCGETRSGSA